MRYPNDKNSVKRLAKARALNTRSKSDMKQGLYSFTDLEKNLATHRLTLTRAIESLKIEKKRIGGRVYIDQSGYDQLKDIYDMKDGYVSLSRAKDELGIAAPLLRKILIENDLEQYLHNVGIKNKRYYRVLMPPEVLDKVRTILEEKNRRFQPIKYRKFSQIGDTSFMTEDLINFLRRRGIDLQYYQGELYIEKIISPTILHEHIAEYMSSCDFIPIADALDILKVSRQALYSYLKRSGCLEDESVFIRFSKTFNYVSRDFVSRRTRPDYDRKKYLTATELELKLGFGPHERRTLLEGLETVPIGIFDCYQVSEVNDRMRIYTGEVLQEDRIPYRLAAKCLGTTLIKFIRTLKNLHIPTEKGYVDFEEYHLARIHMEEAVNSELTKESKSEKKHEWPLGESYTSMSNMAKVHGIMPSALRVLLNESGYFCEPYVVPKNGLKEGKHLMVQIDLSDTISRLIKR